MLGARSETLPTTLYIATEGEHVHKTSKGH